MTPNQKALKKIWGQVPADYYYNLNWLQQIWHGMKWRVFKNLLIGSKPRQILEIGCSSGHLSGQLAALFPTSHITGIDVYAPAIKEAQRRFPKLSFIVADAHQLPFKNNLFDLVLCSETIEHVSNPKKMLHEIARVMKRDGSVLIEMDSGSWLFRIIWWWWTTFNRGKVWQGAHLYPFTAQELEHLIVNNGFRVQKKVFSHFGMAVSFLVKKNEPNK